jgi:hypothetical protein
VNYELETIPRTLAWPILRYCHGIRLDALRKTTKYLTQYSWSPDRDSNQGIPEYFSRSVNHSTTTSFALVIGIKIGHTKCCDI